MTRGRTFNSSIKSSIISRIVLDRGNLLLEACSSEFSSVKTMIIVHGLVDLKKKKVVLNSA